jgi:hypothetical protein
MKTITFQVQNTNFYHTLKEHSITIAEQVKSGFATITGFTKEQIEVGDEINISGNKYYIQDILERRDHSGDFINEETKKGGFFKIETKFSRLINAPQ